MKPRSSLTALASFLAAPLALALAACGSPPASAPAPAVAPAPAAAVASLEVLAPAYAPQLDALSTTLAGKLDELHIPGLALAIVRDDALVYARGFGLADVESQKPVTPETLFAIGSTTKAFTATLVGMLVDEGKLAFDDPVTKVLPWFTLPVQASKGETVCYRDLLAHRTGFVRMDMLWHGTSVPADEILHTAIGAEPLFPFREEFQYNNVMYLAAGRACSEVTGLSWSELIQQRFFEPLGMQSSDTSVTVAQADPRLALGYAWKASEKRFERLPMRNLDSIAPAGSINSNVLDMTRWVRFQLAGGAFEGRRLVSEASFAETWKTHNVVSPEVRYGLGWFLRAWHGQPYVEHGGNIDGFAAQVSLLPEAKLGVVMLCNVSATPLQGAIGPMVFEALLGAPADAAAPVTASAEDLSRFTGTYIANYYQFKDAKFEVLLQNDHLAIDVPGQTIFELLPPGADGKRAFALVPGEIQADFLEEEGRVVELRLYQGGMCFEIPRPDYMPEPELDPAELEPYLGSYADPASGKTFAVVVSRNRLALDYPGQMVYELLLPKDDERWVFRATPNMAVEFHLDADGRAEALDFYERGVKRMCERQDDGGATLPTLEELVVLRKSAAFEARLTELGLCRLSGSMRFVHCGIHGPMTTTFDASGAYADVVDLRPYLWTQTAFDGEHARLRTSSGSEKELRGANLDQTRANGLVSFFGDWSRRFERVAIERIDVTRDQRTLRVKLTQGEAPALVMHVDMASGDLVRAEVSDLVDGGATVNRAVTFEDWRELDGLRLPTRMISEDPGTGRIVIEYTGLEAHLAESDPFALPAALPAR